MTVQDRFTNYQDLFDEVDPRVDPWEQCWPNVRLVYDFLMNIYGGYRLGCHFNKLISGTSRWSTHAGGACFDWNYHEQYGGPGRGRLLSEVIPLLINSSKELGVTAIHDYIADRIWRPPGTSGRSPTGTGWKSVSLPGNYHIHVEFHIDSLSDETPIVARLFPEDVEPPPTPPLPAADGPDVSHWNPIKNPNVVPQYKFFACKATEGHNDRDPMFDFHIEWMRERSFKHRIFYHFLRGDAGMAEQVDNLCRALDDHGGLQDGEAIGLDWEPKKDVPNVTAGEVQSWLLSAERHWPGRAIVYSADWVPGFLEWRAANPDYPLWYPDYNLDPTNPGAGPMQTEQFGATIWQWTSSYSIPGFLRENHGDMNVVLDWDVLRNITTDKEADMTDTYVAVPTGDWATNIDPHIVVTEQERDWRRAYGSDGPKYGTFPVHSEEHYREMVEKMRAAERARQDEYAIIANSAYPPAPARPADEDPPPDQDDPNAQPVTQPVDPVPQGGNDGR